ncbi:hypothetical protein C8J57DRAFT_1713682 [Mycena rebaudengoi]|nr:hypothetical protein C8J57DRAFT_1713682 [Mycena rebaudengoi]
MPSFNCQLVVEGDASCFPTFFCRGSLGAVPTPQRSATVANSTFELDIFFAHGNLSYIYPNRALSSSLHFHLRNWGMSYGGALAPQYLTPTPRHHLDLVTLPRLPRHLVPCPRLRPSHVPAPAPASVLSAIPSLWLDALSHTVLDERRVSQFLYWLLLPMGHTRPTRAHADELVHGNTAAPLHSLLLGQTRSIALPAPSSLFYFVTSRSITHEGALPCLILDAPCSREDALIARTAVDARLSACGFGAGFCARRKKRHDFSCRLWAHAATCNILPRRPSAYSLLVARPDPAIGALPFCARARARASSPAARVVVRRMDAA